MDRIRESALMAIRADTLFRHDANGRMLTHNDPDAHPAPRVFLAWTADSSELRFGVSLPDSAAQEIAEIVRTSPPSRHDRANPEVITPISRILERYGPVTKEGGGPVYRFPEPTPSAQDAVQITEANVELARQSFSWLLTELREWWPCFAVVRDGQAVSVCFSSRIGTAAAEAGVNTVEAYRGRGYAPNVTAAWGAAILASDREPLYSTSWDNLASQAVARRLGLIMFGADISLF